MIQLPEFNSKSDLFAHLRANKSVYLLAKKAEFKHADALYAHHLQGLHPKVKQ